MAKSKQVLSFAQALNVSAILGKCSIKDVGSDLFMPIIRLKSDLNKITEQYFALQKQAYEEAGVKVNADGSITADTPIEKINHIAESIKKFEKSDSGASNFQILTEKSLEKMQKENPTITISELTELLVLLKEKDKEV